MRLVRDFLDVLLYAKVWGSHSHDTQLPTSDIDYLAVYQYPTKQILSLEGYQETVDGTKPDFQSHEIGKFCHLLLKGNPGVVECLFTETMHYSTSEWTRLFEIRDTFLNRATLRQYIGYYDGQLNRLEKGTRLHSTGGTYNTKWAYHLIRIAMDAQRIARGQPPVVFKSGVEKSLLMDIRLEHYTQQSVVDMYNRIRMDVLEQETNLPLEADKSLLNEYLWDLRKGYME